MSSGVIPTTIAVEATLQGLLGAALVRRTMGTPRHINRRRQIIGSLVLGGPVSCLFGVTVGVTTLVVIRQIPWVLFDIRWATWWARDTLGILIVTLLALSWLAEPREIWHRRWTSIALPMVGALTLTLAVFAYTRAQEQVRLQLLFEMDS